MNDHHMIIEQSHALQGTVSLVGAKNAVLVTMASLLLTKGKSTLYNVPASDDVLNMITLLRSLGAEISFSSKEHILEVDTSLVHQWQVPAEMMRKMRASVLVMGPLLARFGKAEIALPGGCLIGQRPINYHLKNFKKMGVVIDEQGETVTAIASRLHSTRIILEYPSVGATENIMMLAVAISGITEIINAALEPEVTDLILVLKKMGAHIDIIAPATIIIHGGFALKPISHEVLVDRLEAGALLLAAAITGGSITITNAQPHTMDVFLDKLEEMGHLIIKNADNRGITLKATLDPKAVSFKTGPYPNFPTDLQAPMMAAQCLAEGISIVEETVFENRLLHVRELVKMGAYIKVEYTKATITGVDHLYGTGIIASDIRASCALVLAAMAARGTSIMTGLHHWFRGYEGLEYKLMACGAKISIKSPEELLNSMYAQHAHRLHDQF